MEVRREDDVEGLRVEGKQLQLQILTERAYALESLAANRRRRVGAAPPIAYDLDSLLSELRDCRRWDSKLLSQSHANLGAWFSLHGLNPTGVTPNRIHKHHPGVVRRKDLLARCGAVHGHQLVTVELRISPRGTEPELCRERASNGVNITD